MSRSLKPVFYFMAKWTLSISLSEGSSGDCPGRAHCNHRSSRERKREAESQRERRQGGRSGGQGGTRKGPQAKGCKRLLESGRENRFSPGALGKKYSLVYLHLGLGSVSSGHVR